MVALVAAARAIAASRTHGGDATGTATATGAGAGAADAMDAVVGSGRMRGRMRRGDGAGVAVAVLGGQQRRAAPAWAREMLECCMQHRAGLDDLGTRELGAAAAALDGGRGKFTLPVLFILDAAMRQGWIEEEERAAVGALESFLNACHPAHIGLAAETFVSLMGRYADAHAPEGAADPEGATHGSGGGDDGDGEGERGPEEDGGAPRHGGLSASARRRAMRAIPTLMHAHAVLLGDDTNQGSTARNKAGHLTPIQPMILRCCLLAQQYRFAAARVLDAAGLITELDPGLTAVTQMDLLLYCYYGGTVLIGMHRYEDAADLLVHALTSPTQVASHVTLCAFKRFLIASMFCPGGARSRRSRGQNMSNRGDQQNRPGAERARPGPSSAAAAAGTSLPKYTPMVVQRAVQQGCAAYLELDRAYLSGNAEELDAAVRCHERTFRRDGNWGIVSLLPRALVASGIRRLAETYVTFPLGEIAAKVRLTTGEEAERRVLSMVRESPANSRGFAKINQSDAMLEFPSSPEGEGGRCYSSAETIRRLDHGMRQMMHLSDKLAEIDEAISCDRDFINMRLSREKSLARYDSAAAVSLGATGEGKLIARGHGGAAGGETSSFRL